MPRVTAGKNEGTPRGHRNSNHARPAIRLSIKIEELLEYLRDLVQARYFFDPIDEVVFEPTAVPTFDVVMPEAHSFWANGFMSHNTTPPTPKR